MRSILHRSGAALASSRLSPLANTVIVAGGYFFSRVLGLVRDVIILAQFGTGTEIDAYRASFTIIDMIYLVVAGGALSSAFIPVFSGFLAEDREEDAWQMASGVLNLALLALLGACVVVALLADPIVAWSVGTGFDPAKRALTVQILRLLLIQPILLGLGGLAKATLESFDRFALPAIGSNLYNLGIIAGALFLAPWLQIYGLVWGVCIGAALFLLIQLPGLYGIGMRYVRSAGIHVPGVRQVGRLLGPRLFGQSAWQINLIAITSFASLLGDGPIAANAAGFQLMLLPHGLIALSLGTVIFPRLARYHAVGDQEGLRVAALGGVRTVLFLALPAAALMAVLRLPILRLLFQRGAFDTISTALTAEALAGYALGLAAFAAAEIIVRTFYAMHDTRTPVYIGISVVAINIALAWVLLQLGLGLGGLALAFSISNIIEATTLLVLLGKRLGGIDAGFWRALGGMALATLACGALGLALLQLSQPVLPFLRAGDRYRWPVDFVPLALWLALAFGLGTAAYAGVAALMGVEELRVVRGRVRGLVARVIRR